MEKEKITIIIPAYNAQTSIGRCLESAIKQSLDNIEIIIVNDGSTDSTYNICESYEKKDSRIRLYSTSNQGVSAARNYGLSKATGTYIMFLDSDDLFVPAACEIALNHIIGHDCAIFGIHQESGINWGPKSTEILNIDSEFINKIPDLVDSEILSPCLNKIYKKDLITSEFPKTLSFGEDLVFVLNYLHNCHSISLCQEFIYVQDNLNIHSITHNYRKGRLKEIEINNKHILDFGQKDSSCVLINKKYVRDILTWLCKLYNDPEMKLVDINNEIRNWVYRSYLRNMNLSLYELSFKSRLILEITRYNFYPILSCLYKIKNKIRG